MSMKPALLVIDVQKAFFESDAKTVHSLKDAIENINEAIALFRAKGLPVIAIQHMDEKDDLVPGKAGYDLPEELHILPSDIHILKTYGNAFNKTALQSKLNKLGVDTLILTGYCAEYCVLSTSIGAENLDLTPIILRGALASGSRKNIRFVESINEIISFAALEKFLE
jgi:nicotinamidase-related amidase